MAVRPLDRQLVGRCRRACSHALRTWRPAHDREAPQAALEREPDDLTEDVPTTNRVLELASNDPKVVYVPQCGLAPGLLGIVGSWLAKDFDSIGSIELQVGALPRHPTGLLGYAFNWSPEGVVNEYLWRLPPTPGRCALLGILRRGGDSERQHETPRR